MINCDNGKIGIEGDVAELVLNYLQITDELLNLQPEIVLSVFYKRKTALDLALNKSNSKALQACEILITHCDKGRTEL